MSTRMMPDEWLARFLASEGRGRPDDRLLRCYGCTDREYRSLIRLLTRVGEPKHLRQAFRSGVPTHDQPLEADDANATMPAFVLYASEWFYREWDGQARQKLWQGIMHGIGWSPEEPHELYRAMAAGLKWWNHDVIEGIKAHYLETLAYQGDAINVTGLRAS